jgi:hypothetical protein
MGKKMTEKIALPTSKPSIEKSNQNGSLVLGVGLAVASMILVPAIAMRLGLGASLTGALRIALMKASSHATHGGKDDSGAASAGFSCH